MEFDAEDAIQLLRTMRLHVVAVQQGMQAISRELERRALIHDQSKFSGDEFAAFSRINKAAREHPYGSEEYRAGLRQEKPTIDLHYARNSHHPEHHEIQGGEAGYDGMYKAEGMGFLDIIEMVCDWRSAYLTYGSQGTWAENVDRQRERYKDWFTKGQWWLIDQVAAFVVEATA